MLNSKQIDKLRALRKVTFRKRIEHDYQLNKLVEGYASHAFLANPPSQYIYQYLVEYTLLFAADYLNKPLKQLKVLDWGCGKGHITYMLQKRGIEVVSCDVQDNNDLDSAFGQDIPIIHKTNISVVPLTHPYQLPFSNQEFDVVLSFGVLEHVPNDLESLKELSRVLKPGGLLFCYFLPYPFSWTQKLAHIKGDFYHDRFYNRKTVNQLLQASNFELLDYWHRALFPKNSINYPAFKQLEQLDQLLCEYTPFKHLATNVEFVAVKQF